MRVAVRARPTPAGKPAAAGLLLAPGENTVTLGAGPATAAALYTLNGVYASQHSNQEVFEAEVHPAVLSALKGFSGTVIAFGATGSGKARAACLCKLRAAHACGRLLTPSWRPAAVAHYAGHWHGPGHGAPSA